MSPLTARTLPVATDTKIAPEVFFRGIGYVTLKVTNGCNLRCTYCNVEADLPATPRMSLDVFRRAADLLIPNAESKYLGLEFHGGEPLLLDDAWYEEAVGYAAQLAKKHDKVMQHPLQTNGTMLTPERLDALLGLGIHIGISCDGPPAINDEYRSAGKAVERGIRALLERKRGLGLILVLSKANCGRMPEVMDWLREVGVEDYRINFMQPQGYARSHDELSSDEMFEGMRDVFEHMAATDCSVIEGGVVQFVNRFVLGRLSKPALSCWEYQCQAGRTYVAVNHRGDVYSCGTDMEKHQLGSLFEPFDHEHVKATRDRLHLKDPWYARCFDCSAHRICALNCPTTDTNSPTYRDSECAYTKRLYSYLQHHPVKVRRVYERLRQLRARPVR